MAINCSIYETEELGDLYSDYHKDVFGFRPRDVSAGDREGLIAGIRRINLYMFKMKSTPSGRQQLREEGWVIEEPI